MISKMIKTKWNESHCENEWTHTFDSIFVIRSHWASDGDDVPYIVEWVNFECHLFWMSILLISKRNISHVKSWSNELDNYLKELGGCGGVRTPGWEHYVWFLQWQHLSFALCLRHEQKWIKCYCSGGGGGIVRFWSKNSASCITDHVCTLDFDGSMLYEFLWFMCAKQQCKKKKSIENILQNSSMIYGNINAIGKTKRKFMYLNLSEIERKKKKTFDLCVLGILFRLFVWY